MDFVPDIFLYCTVAVLSGPLLVVVYRRQQLGVTVSITMTILLLIVDLGLVVYYSLQSNLQTQLRPAYTTYILLVIYSFLPIVRNRQAVVLGIIVSLCHLLVLASVTYKTSPNRSSLVSVFYSFNLIIIVDSLEHRWVLGVYCLSYSCGPTRANGIQLLTKSSFTDWQ